MYKEGRLKIWEDWQLPLMQAMAGIVTETHGEVLEIGFGRGGFSDLYPEWRCPLPYHC